MSGNNKRIFIDIENHLLNDKKPSLYLRELLKSGVFRNYPFSVIGDLVTVEQNLKYHPEGNVFNHTMMVVDEGAQNRDKSKNKRAFMWTLLLHDIGKFTDDFNEYISQCKEKGFSIDSNKSVQPTPTTIEVVVRCEPGQNGGSYDIQITVENRYGRAYYLYLGSKLDSIVIK